MKNVAREKRNEPTEIVANSARLLSDAKLLADNERFPSAFALAVLAVEEIGKLIFHIWNSENPFPPPRGRGLNHREKQKIVGCLILAKRVIEFSRPHILNGVDTEEIVEPLAKAMFESKEGKFVRLAEMGAVDKTKELALYRDEWLAEIDLHTDNFDYSDVAHFFERAKEAMSLVSDDLVMKTARAIYETGQSKKSG